MLKLWSNDKFLRAVATILNNNVAEFKESFIFGFVNKMMVRENISAKRKTNGCCGKWNLNVFNVHIFFIQLINYYSFINLFLKDEKFQTEYHFEQV